MQAAGNSTVSFNGMLSLPEELLPDSWIVPAGVIVVPMSVQLSFGGGLEGEWVTMSLACSTEGLFRMKVAYEVVGGTISSNRPACNETTSVLIDDDNPTETPVDEVTITVVVSGPIGTRVNPFTGERITIWGFGVSGETATLTDAQPWLLGEYQEFTVDEGQFVSFYAGTVDDPGQNDTHVVTVVWGDLDGFGNPVIDQVPSASGQGVSLSHTYLDDFPSGTPSDSRWLPISVQDDDTLSGGGPSIRVTVNNVAPTLSVSATDTADVGEPVVLNCVISDPGFHDTYVVDVDWGDGTTSSWGHGTLWSSGDMFTESHVYATAGSYTISAIVTDDDTGQGSASTGTTINDTPDPDPGRRQRYLGHDVVCRLEQHVDRFGNRTDHLDACGNR